MGRAKDNIRKIDDSANRKITFMERRNGLIKKAYELSVLCDIDLAIIFFSPSGTLNLFSGEKRIEDILSRFISLPEHQRGQVQNIESLQMILQRMKNESNLMAQLASRPTTLHAKIEELQQEINRFQYQLVEVEKQLRVFEGDPLQITTLQEAILREQTLQEVLLRVQKQKQKIEGKYLTTAFETNVQQQKENGHESLAEDENQTFNWLAQEDELEKVLDYLSSNNLLPMREEQVLEPQSIPQETQMGYAVVSSKKELDVSNHLNLDNPSNKIGMSMHHWSEHASASTRYGNATQGQLSILQLGIPNPGLQTHEDEFSSSPFLMNNMTNDDAAMFASFPGQFATEKRWK